MRRFLAFFLCFATGYAQNPNAYSELLAKAHAGDGHAAYALGSLYATPSRGDPDYGGAAYWYDQGSKHGIPEATLALANLYLNGAGVPRDDSKAFELYERVANTGNPAAMAQLGEAMIVWNYRGNGTYYARRWIEKAANASEPNALNDLGWITMNQGPGGVAPPVRVAQNYFLKAAQGGSCAAMLNIGNLYMQGSYEFSFNQDAKQAEDWFARTQTCPGSTSELRKTAAELQRRASRGELPPVNRQHTATASSPDGSPKTLTSYKDAILAISLVAAVGALLHVSGDSGSEGESGTTYGASCPYSTQSTQVYVPNSISGGTYETQWRIRPPGGLCSPTY